jgi:ABC-type multidrug transport system permease subunit
MKMSNQKMMHSAKGHNRHYRKLLIMAVLSFISMYILMYSMVNVFSNVFPNVNQFYMAGLMTMPMIIIEVLLMGSMYMNKKLNAGIIAISIVALIAFFTFIRQQTGVSDRQFLRGMIPHHAAAILMAGKAKITDPEIKKLTEEIISSQQKEIDFMKAKLKEMNTK